MRFTTHCSAWPSIVSAMLMLFGNDVYEKYRRLWEVLVERGWLEVSPNALRLTGDGIFFTPTIQDVLSRPRVQAIQAARVRSARREREAAV